MRALLLYNPVSGRNHLARAETMQAVAEILRTRYPNLQVAATTAPGSAAWQARDAIIQGTELILACGGDGTVHDALQGLVAPNAPHSPLTDCAKHRPVLGVIPLGSANALARHLGLSTDPLSAARQVLTFAPRTVPVGCIETPTGARYFTVLAGAGPSGALVYPGTGDRARIFPASKRRLGRLAYYLRAATLFLTHPFPAFDLRWLEPPSHESPEPAAHAIRAVGAMAVRISSLGGLFHPLAPAAQVHHPHLTLVAVRPPGWLGLSAWFAGSWLRQRHRTPLVVHAQASQFTITPAPNSRPIHLQADGEWVGTAPAHIRLIPNALQLLMPAGE